MCPYAYQTSLWIRNVRDETGLDIRWQFFSLEEINRAGGQEAPVGAGLVLRLVDDADRGPAAPPGHGPARPVVRGGRSGPPRGRAQAPPSRGGRGHPGARWVSTRDWSLGPSTIPPPADEVMAEHERVVARGGFGVPTMIFDDDQMLFGPVLVNPPVGRRRACDCGT